MLKEGNRQSSEYSGSQDDRSTMAMSNFTCHHIDGFDDDPKNGKGYYLAKDGRFYTYEDLSRANKRYHHKKFELDKIRHGLTNRGNLQSAALTRKTKASSSNASSFLQ